MQFHFAVHPHIRGAYCSAATCSGVLPGSSPHTWGIQTLMPASGTENRFIPTYVGHTVFIYLVFIHFAVHPHIRGAYPKMNRHLALFVGSSPHTWGIHWTAVRKMAGFSHFSYDFTRKSYFVQGLVFFGVIGAEAFPTHRRGRSQCLPGAHGGSGLGRRSVTCPDSGTPQDTSGPHCLLCGVLVAVCFPALGRPRAEIRFALLFW